MPMLCLKEFKIIFILARKYTEYNCTIVPIPFLFITSIGALNLRELSLLKLVKDPPATKGRKLHSIG